MDLGVMTVGEAEGCTVVMLTWVLEPVEAPVRDLCHVFGLPDVEGVTTPGP